MNALKNERNKIKFDIFSTDRKLLLKAFALIRLFRKPFSNVEIILVLIMRRIYRKKTATLAFLRSFIQKNEIQ